MSQTLNMKPIRPSSNIAQITDAILEKYNRPGPRYTSYPTAPVWKDDFGPDDLESFYARAEDEAHAAFALHAPSLLRKPLPVLRLQCFHSKR